jgi:hypothetical protein
MVLPLVSHFQYRNRPTYTRGVDEKSQRSG